MKYKVHDKYYKSTESLLYNYNGLKLSIQSMTEELMEIDRNNGMAGISYDEVQTSESFKINKVVEELALTNIGNKDDLKKKIRRMRICIRNIDRAIEQLPETEVTIIREKYFSCKPWYKVAYLAHLSERHCRRIRSEAVARIAVSLHGDVAIENLIEIE